MKKWIILLLLALPFWAAAQAPDNARIEEQIFDKNSKYFYPDLFNRYMKGDTTLNLEDYRHLYYGYAFDPKYQPFDTPHEADSVIMLFEQNPDPQLADCKRIIDYGNKVLFSEPFNMRIINVLTYAYGIIGDTENEYNNYYRFKMLMETIMSSGTGTSEKSPWHVLYLNDVEDVMAYLELKYLKRTVISRTTEYLPLLQKQGKIKGYYFEFSRVFSKKPEQERKHGGWEFNGIKIK